MLRRDPYSCTGDCIMYVHAMTHQFVHDQVLCTCAEDYFMYDHARHHYCVYDRSP